MKANINGISIYYEKYGKGEPIVMIHGNSQNGKIFDVAAAELSKSYTVYLPDSRSHGKSEKVKHLHYDDIASDTAEFIKTVIGEKAVVYGLSDGGIIGILLAINYPETVKNVIVSGANSTPSGLKNNLSTIYKIGYFFSHSDFIRLMLKEPNITKEQLNSVKVPVHVIAGEKDVIKESDTRFIAENIPCATLEIIKNEGHSSYVTHSEKLCKIIGKYL